MEENKKRKRYLMQFDETLDGNSIEAISLVEKPAVEEFLVALSEQKPVDLATVSTEKRIVCSVILKPDMPILRIDEATGEEYEIIFDAPTIEKMAYSYLKNNRANNVTVEHTEGHVNNVYLAESWIVSDKPELDKSVALGLGKQKPGTWVGTMSLKNNSEMWNLVKEGRLQGFSIEAILGHKLIKASATEPTEEELELSREGKTIEELKFILAEYLETITSVDSTYEGQPASGSITSPAVM